MNAVANDGKPLPVGRVVRVCTNNPYPVGAEFNVVDRHGQVLNVARVTHVALRTDISERDKKYGKYLVEGRVEQEVSTQEVDPLVARVYWN